uniref:Uncharacterized protein n=1 Tax=Kalanchoe fedtschenkoi TaxID=63787 RepID=A0A7N0USB5_KALFE
MDLKNIRDAFDRVTKKQKLSSSKTKEMMDHICQEVENAITKIQSSMDSGSEVDTKSVFSELNAKLMELGPISPQEGTQRELSIALSKYPKLLEKSLNPDISKAYRNVDFDTHVVNHIIASHFYRQGMFDIGDTFIAESNEPEAAAVKSQFLELYHILSAMTTRNLEPALTWASANHDKLRDNGSDLVLKLHRLHFVEILQSCSRDDALMYARTYLAPFATSHMAEFQKLMACLLWAQKLDHSPYADLLSPSHWDTIGEELMRQFCNILGQSYESPLSVTIAAGVQALPQLLKLMNVVVEKKQDDWQSIKQLPVPLDLDKEFQFHSIFVCPVSKDQASEDNPPMLMSCGHVLCRQSIAKMSKNNTKSFKCPYCPMAVESKLCKQLYF